MRAFQQPAEKSRWLWGLFSGGLGSFGFGPRSFGGLLVLLRQPLIQGQACFGGTFGFVGTLAGGQGARWGLCWHGGQL